MQRIFVGGLMLATLVGFAPGPARAAEDAICANQLLSYNERTLCKDQITNANTKTERKALQAKYRERVKEREEGAKKEK